MTYLYKDATPPAERTPASPEAVHKSPGSTWVALGCAILGVCIIFTITLVWRFSYINQIPVYDLDYITAVLTMFARNWWVENPWAMHFSMPYAPLSVEAATPELRYAMYQSWPPGAVLSIYLVAKLVGSEPSIVMVNWLNVAGHGLIALFLSLSAWRIADILGRPRIEGVALAVVAACLVLFPRGPVFFFSQVFSFDTHIVVFYAFLVFALTLEVGAAERPSARWYYRLQIAILICGLFVDWLFYFVFAVWLALRLVGSRAGWSRPVGWKDACALTVLPLATFFVFLVWRFSTPGSIAASQGVLASLQELLWKLVFRIGNTDDHPVSAASFFGGLFLEMHRFWYWAAAPILVGAGFILCFGLFAAVFSTSRTNPKQRSIWFGLFSIFILSIIPAYAQMIVFKQHTTIHPWSIAKVVVPLAMVPGVFLPLLFVNVLARWTEPWRRHPNVLFRVMPTLVVLLFAFGICASAWPPRSAYFLGQINPAAMVPWLTIHEKTTFSDVAFSPDFEADPLGYGASVASKVVYRARSFADIDRKVEHICVPFNVVVVRKAPDAVESFDGRTPDQTVRSGGLTLLRFQNYRGAAKNCAKT